MNIVFLSLSQTLCAADRYVICYGGVSGALIPVADYRGFFRDEGVDVALQRFPSGKQALEAMFAKQCDLAAVAEIPVAHYSLLGKDIPVIAAISMANDYERIIVRSDRGIAEPVDLRGRRIAVPEFTSAHYFLDLFLVVHGLLPQDVIQAFLPAQEIAAAFQRGDVDAAVHWEPHIQILATSLSSNTKVFSMPGLHVGPNLLVSSRDWLNANPVAGERILRALLRAESYVLAEPRQAQDLLAHNYAVEPSEMAVVWPSLSFQVRLDQSLPFMLENATRWELKLMPEDQRPAMPNYLERVYSQGLLNVKPDAVSIIH